MAFNPYYGYTPQYGRNPYIQQPIVTQVVRGQSATLLSSVRFGHLPPANSKSYFI